MASVTAHATDDVRSDVTLVRAIVLSVAELSAVLAGLVLVVTEGTVQGGELSKLATLEFVLSFGSRCRLWR